MISDPKTVPDHRVGAPPVGGARGRGRRVHPLRASSTRATSSGRWPSAPPWCRSSTACFPTPGTSGRATLETTMERRLAAVPLALLALVLSRPAWAFCGFYVSQANTKLYNHSSKVVLVRDGDKTIITMESDFSRVAPGLRGGDPGAHEDRAGTDPHRRRAPGGSPGQVLGAAAGALLRPEPLRAEVRRDPVADALRPGGGGGDGSARHHRAAVARASPSRPATRSATTTSSSSRRSSRAGSSPGSPRTATRSPPAPARWSAATSSSRCTSSWPR